MNQNNSLSPTIYEGIITIVFLYVVFLLSYGAINKTVSIPSSYNLSISIDNQMPFIPFFIYPFYIAFIIFPLPVLFMKSRRQLKTTALAFLVMLGIACSIFIIFPAFVPRPDVFGGAFTEDIIVRIYKIDRPVCTFPSLHVAVAFFATFIVFKMSTKWGFLCLMFSLLICLTVLFIKQHVFLDVLGGFFLSAAVFWSFRKLL